MVIDSTTSADHRLSEAKTLKLIVDIAIVSAMSAVAFFLEGLIDAQGWISVGAAARGVSAVLAGALTAVAIVIARGGTLADLGLDAGEFGEGARKLKIVELTPPRERQAGKIIDGDGAEAKAAELAKLLHEEAKAI